MRKHFLLLLFFLTIGCQSAQKTTPLPWLNDWKEGEAALLTTKKPLLIEVAVDWCPTCKFIEERILGQKEVKQALESFTLLKLDGDLAKNQPFMDEWRIRWYPTFVVIDSNKKELARFSELVNARELLEILSSINKFEPGLRELAEATALRDTGKIDEAKLFYEKAVRLLSAQNHPALEKGLFQLSELTSGAASKKYLQELVKMFPNSVLISDYLMKLSETYESTGLKEKTLKQAANTLELQLNNFSKASNEISPEIRSHLITTLSEIYEKLGRTSEVQALFLREAKLFQDWMSQLGGPSHARHLIMDTAYLYRKSGAAQEGLKFLEQVAKELPDYWPVYYSSAKIRLELKQFDKAALDAKKGYELAREVAKSKLALLWAKVEQEKGNLKKSKEILQNAKEDLIKLGNTQTGRAKRMLVELENRLR